MEVSIGKILPLQNELPKLTKPGFGSFGNAFQGACSRKKGGGLTGECELKGAADAPPPPTAALRTSTGR